MLMNSQPERTRRLEALALSKAIKKSLFSTRVIIKNFPSSDPMHAPFDIDF